MAEKEKKKVDKQNISAMAIGTVLREQRESLGMSQQDIAQELNYKNYNYISMLENGRSSVPVKRIHDIFEAYKFDSSLFSVFIKKLMPDVWALFAQIALKEKMFETKEAADKFDKEVDERFDELLRKFGLDKYSKLINEL